MEASSDFNLIDVSSENDSLIAAVGDHDPSSALPSHSPGNIGENGGDGGELGNGSAEKFSQPFEITEPESIKKSGKYNLRKSLAWDSAFFESPGFLDAEDISTMIDGAQKAKQHLLPGIDEDISRSTESISTLLSENLTLESLESELFEDIRASIQKSSKASGISKSSLKAAAEETDKPIGSSVKKVDTTPRNRIAANKALTMQSGGMQGSGRILKKDSNFPPPTQPDLRKGKSASSLSQPSKVITKPGTVVAITAKRASIGVNRTRDEINNSKAGVKGIQVPKAAGLTGPRRNVPKPASFLEASNSVSSGASNMDVGRSSSSSNNGGKSTFTKKVHKIASTSLSTKTEVKPVIKASSSIPKSSSKVPLRKKPSGKSGLPSSLMSSKITSSMSPSSSVSEWSSASSSTSTANQRFMSRTSIDANTLCSTDNQKFSARMSFDTNSSLRSMDSDTLSILSSDVQSNGDMSDGNLNHFKEYVSQDAKKSFGQSSVLSRSALTKPSGLRMPSPKIGFFDGAKSVVRTPSGCRQSQPLLPTGLPKVGVAIRSPVGSLKKAEETIPLKKKAAAGAITVLETLKSASPKLSQEPLMAPMEVHSANTNNLSSPDLSSEMKSSNKTSGKQQPERTSTNLELEGPNFASSKPSQERVPSVSPDVHYEIDGSNCLKTEYVKSGKPDSAKQAIADAPEPENDENLLINI
ncbi:uncharacterized protein LOC108220550 isoform X1 [Daucus carota subsp. sativus]|uniref:uncharacterized protein LOC108220550 isoform X1 n=1 Tax=Daucus carota subsp. sativus TaxID=79200 RepID=UPI0007F046A9|nr:PREDICTED: uncharacterized protein LOC108220550 isoform X1 [Daucus carota subsp. sativus]